MVSTTGSARPKEQGRIETEHRQFEDGQRTMNSICVDIKLIISSYLSHAMTVQPEDSFKSSVLLVRSNGFVLQPMRSQSFPRKSIT